MWFLTWIMGEEILPDDEIEAGCWKSHSERWHVQSVVVRQEWRRKGVASQLMGRVMDRAAAEGVAVTLEATEGGEKLYSRLGFKVVDRAEGDDGEESGALMIWMLDDET